MDNTAKVLDREAASFPALKLEPPAVPSVVARGSVEWPDFTSASVDHYSDGRVLLSLQKLSVSVMLHFTTEEWAQLTALKPVEGT